MKLFGSHAAALAAGIFSLGLTASVVAADRSANAERRADEYDQAVNRANKEYETANHRCEELGMRERNLCRADSLAARDAAITDAQTRRGPPSGLQPISSRPAAER